MANAAIGMPEREVIYELDEAAGDRIEIEYEAADDGEEPRKVRARVVRVSGGPSTHETPTEPLG